jgi:aminoglycoside 3-N-acetyltransferase
MNQAEPPIVTRSQLVRGLHEIGVRPGGVLMLHASVRAVGWVVGGPDVVLQALLDVLGPEGTLMMYVGWEESVYEFTEWPEEKQRAYLEECPPFDPATSRAYRDWSILTEYLRTWPGARRSNHPEASVAAVGARADWITSDHPLQYGYGRGSPLEKLCQAGGQVLLLGAPLETLTVLHYAEHIADVPDKRIARYKMPVLRGGQRVWADFEEYDTSDGIVDWEGEDYFITIARAFLASGQGRSGHVGAAPSYLFAAAALVQFGVAWMERHFVDDGRRTKDDRG